MTVTLPKVIADFTTTIVNSVAVGDTTATLTSVVDQDGVTAPTGMYGLTIDRKNSQKEYYQCTLTGTSLTNIKTVTRGTAVATAGFARAHRKGAEVIISDWFVLKRIVDLLDGTTGFDSAAPIKYDTHPTFSADTQIVDKKYIDDIVIAGAPDASTSTKGISKLSSAPVSPTDPIAVGDTDTRVPTQGENDALAGTSGNPSSTNKYETENDTTNGATLTAATISFTASTKTISDSNSGFSTAEFRIGDSIIVSGSGSNDGTYTIVSVAAGAIVVVETLVDESAGATVTLATVTINKLVRTKSDGTLPYTVLPSGGNLFAGFVAGENIAANDAVAIGDGTQADIADTTYNSSNSVNIFAANTTAKWGAFTFVTPTGKNVSLKTVSLSSRQTQNGGQPSPNLTLSIRATSGGLPTGSDLDSSVIVDNTYSSGIQQRTFTFTGNYILAQGATYALVFRTAAGSYEVYANATSTDSGVTWGVPTLNSTPAHVLSAQELLTAGQIWKASALRNNSRLNNFIGFSPNAITAGNSDKVIGNGFVDGFTGLTAGITYYLSDTNGAVSSTSGTYAKKIGRSTKTTQIEMQSKPSLYKWDQPLSVAANYQATTDGFVVGYVVGNGNATVYSDNTATPSVIRQQVGNFSGNTVDRIGFTVPIRRGDYVRVDSSAGTVTIYWMPLS